MKAYVTKYALTEGILEVECEHQNDGYLSFPSPQNPNWNICATRNQWRKTREEAVTLSNAMRDKKVKNLKAQVDRLEALKFE